LKEEPAVSDEGGDVSEVGPEGGEQRCDGGLNVIQRVEEAVADLVLELIEEFFHGIEFRAVGRELKKMDRFGMGWEPGFWWKPAPSQMTM
jgi:hypothetical protein